MTKRILISGYYGFNNAGDEAVLLAILHSLRAQCPQWKPVVLSADPTATTRLYGVEAYYRWSRREAFSQIRACTALISGGGSLLQDVTGQASLLYYLGLILAAKLMGKPVFIYAQGLGPLVHGTSKLLVRTALRHVDAVVLRDKASRNLLLSLGLTRPVSVTADPVFGLEPEGIADRNQAMEALRQAGIEPEGGRLALINLRELPGPHRAQQQQLEDAVAGLANYLRSQGWQVLLLPLQWPGDLEACRRMAAENTLSQALPLPGLLGIIALADLVVGLRLHALVFAALLGRPLAGIIYDPKVAAFLKQVNAPGITVSQLTPEKITQLVVSAWEQREDWIQSLPSIMDFLRQRAVSTTGILKELLEGTSAPIMTSNPL